MTEKQPPDNTAAGEHAPHVHDAGEGTATAMPISLEQDKNIREGNYPRELRDDMRMKDLPDESGFSSGAKADE